MSLSISVSILVKFSISFHDWGPIAMRHLLHWTERSVGKNEDAGWSKLKEEKLIIEPNNSVTFLKNLRNGWELTIIFEQKHFWLLKPHPSIQNPKQSRCTKLFPLIVLMARPFQTRHVVVPSNIGGPIFRKCVITKSSTMILGCDSKVSSSNQSAPLQHQICQSNLKRRLGGTCQMRLKGLRRHKTYCNVKVVGYEHHGVTTCTIPTSMLCFCR